MRQSSLDLAVIGNCQVSALIDREATIVWSCWPRPDSDPIFCGLLKPEGGDSADGVLAVRLHGQRSTSQSYERNTAIVETRLTDEQGGEVRVTDFCPRFRAAGRLFRPATLVRIIEPLAGRPQLRIRLRPTVRYGAESPAITVVPLIPPCTPLMLNEVMSFDELGASLTVTVYVLLLLSAAVTTY